MGTFSVTIERRGGTVLVRPSGELDVMTAPRLEQALVGVLGEHRTVLVDLSGVPFADCAGLRPIRQALREARTSGTEIELRDPVPAVRRVLQLTGLRPPTALV